MRTLSQEEAKARRNEMLDLFPDGIPKVENSSEMTELGYFYEFGRPKGRHCIHCGAALPKGEGWSTSVVLERTDGSTAGWATALHCNECHPTDVAKHFDFGETQAIQPPVRDSWRFVQGELI